MADSFRLIEEDSFRPVEDSFREVTDSFRPDEQTFGSLAKTAIKTGVGAVLKGLKPEAFPKEFDQPLLGITEPPSKKIEQFGPLKARPEHVIPGTIRTTARGTTKYIADILTTPSSYIYGLGMKQISNDLLTNPVTRSWLQRNFPRLLRGPLRATDPEWIRLQDWLKNPRVSPTPAELVKPQVSVIDKFNKILKTVRPLRTEQEAIYSAERAVRFGKVAGIQRQQGGEAGFYKELGALKGQYTKKTISSIRKQFNQDDLNELFNMIKRNGDLLPGEKVTAQDGMRKLLEGQIPTEGELKLMGEIYPAEFIKTILDKRQLWAKVMEGAGEVLNVPRAIMASTDLSFGFRQGIFVAARHPLLFSKSFINQFKYFFSSKAYKGSLREIHSRPTYKLMREAKLPLTEIGGRLSQREEAFMGSQLAEKIPIWRYVQKASNRAYTGFANRLRADYFDWMIKTARKVGVEPKGRVLTDIGRFIGTATGRGELPQAIEKAAVALNATFFSPRLVFSRLHLLNPVYYAKLDPFVRKEALKSLFSFASAGLGILSLAKMGGADVEDDPRNADFGKIKVGNTRYDIWGGFQQPVRLAAQLITGEIVSSTTGTTMTLGEGYRAMTRPELLARGVEMKLAPIASFALALGRGSTAIGDEVKTGPEIAKQLGLRVTPMVIQDFYDLYREDEDFRDMIKASPAIFGVGVQTYGVKPENVVGAKVTVQRQINQLNREGRTEEADALRLKFEKTTELGNRLAPLVENIRELKKTRELITKNVDYSKAEKKDMTSGLDKDIKMLEEQLQELYKELK